MYKTICSPIEYGGLPLKNRVIFAPTTLGLDEDAYLAQIKEIAQGGCAMIIIGDVPVLRKGFGPSLYKKKGFLHYQKLAQIAHAENCMICAQLHQSDSNIKAMLKYIPGVLTKRISMEQLRTLLNEEVGPYITNMPEKQVKQITSFFGDAAVLAKEAGFDMVQVHGDRMCGSFSSTVFNHRTDQYGGSIPNRARFAVESITAIRRLLPDIPIDYKLAVRQEHPHYGNAGILVDELSTFIPLLEQAGVTSFHVTLANHGSLEDTIPPANHAHFSGEGCFLPFCDLVRQYTNLPICGVGGLTDPAYIEQQLESGRVDCVAMSRQLIADPDWPNKVSNNQTNLLHRCVRCNKKCLGGLKQHQGVHCIYDKNK